MRVLSEEEVMKSRKEAEKELAKKQEEQERLGPKDKQFQELLNRLSSPVEVQKEVAARIGLFLKEHINQELENEGKLSEYTRRWIKQHNEILASIHKNLFGDKQLHTHELLVGHSHIAAKIRERRKKKEITVQKKEGDVVDADYTEHNGRAKTENKK